MTDPAAAADVGAEVIAARWRALSAGIDLPELTESWHPDAACRPGVAPKGVDWFASDRHGIAAAIAVCDRCRVADECLAAAARRGERYGVWGGVVATLARPITAASSIEGVTP